MHRLKRPWHRGLRVRCVRQARRDSELHVARVSEVLSRLRGSLVRPHLQSDHRLSCLQLFLRELAPVLLRWFRSKEGSWPLGVQVALAARGQSGAGHWLQGLTARPSAMMHCVT